LLSQAPAPTNAKAAIQSNARRSIARVMGKFIGPQSANHVPAREFAQSRGLLARCASRFWPSRDIAVPVGSNRR
jgi:hypothetical protein